MKIEKIEILLKNQIISQKETLSFKEALIYLDVSKSFLYKMTSNKMITFTKPNKGKVYFKKKDLNDWMKLNETESISKLQENFECYIKKENNER